MVEVLVVIWFAAAIGGVVAAVLGLLSRVRRHASLRTAGVCFAVAGVLGVLSIGVVFLAASVICFVAASRTGSISAPAAASGT